MTGWTKVYDGAGKVEQKPVYLNKICGTKTCLLDKTGGTQAGLMEQGIEQDRWKSTLLNGATVWFFSTVTKDEDIMQKLEELAKFWKKLQKDERLQFFVKRF